MTFTEAPGFGSDLRRVSGDYAVLDRSAGTVVFAVPPAGEVRAAGGVVKLAERLSGEVDGTNRVFAFSETPVVETEPYDIYIGNMQLSDDDERPEERVDGERAAFTFESAEGIVTADGAPLNRRRRLHAGRLSGDVYSTTCPKRATSAVSGRVSKRS